VWLKPLTTATDYPTDTTQLERAQKNAWLDWSGLANQQHYRIIVILIAVRWSLSAKALAFFYVFLDITKKAKDTNFAAARVSSCVLCVVTAQPIIRPFIDFRLLRLSLEDQQTHRQCAAAGFRPTALVL